MHDFAPLWRTMKERGITEYGLITKYYISRGTISSLRHNKNVNIHTICTLCEILDCKIEDVVEYKRAEKE